MAISLLQRYGFLFVCLAFVIVMFGICLINRRRRRYALQAWPPLEYVPEGVPEDMPIPELSEVWLEDEKGLGGPVSRDWPGLQPLCAVRMSNAQTEPTLSPTSSRKLFHFSKRDEAWVAGLHTAATPAPDAVQAAFVVSMPSPPPRDGEKSDSCGILEGCEYAIGTCSMVIRAGAWSTAK
ncbi:hypothetical protein PENSPDRAFT_689349 [Peniophora sp. CONT]|nr:hypothetical protein PENSPDRAFT_689349 [Peniophora sp. CONT]